MIFLSLLLSILWNVGEQRTQEDEQQVLSSGKAAEFYWEPSTDIPQPKAAQELAGEAGMGWNEAGATSPALTTLLRGSTADRRYFGDSPESWDILRGQ